MSSRFFVLFLVVLFPVSFPLLANSQTITLNTPSSSVELREGDDFASEQLQNPWDFSQRRDIGWEENFVGTSVDADGGIWSGVNEIAGGYVLPLFPGFKGSLFAEGLTADLYLPKLGINHKIKASKYKMLSFKMNHTARSTIAVYWNNDESKPQYWPDGSQYGAVYDGYFTQSQGHVNDGWTIYYFDLSDLADSFTLSAGSWSGNVFALRLDPSITGAAGATTELDWIRLVDPGSAPDIDFTWTTVGFDSSYVISLYVDNNSSGFDGVPVKRFSNGTDPGSFSLPSAILPAGKHYFYLELTTEDGTLLDRSGYSPLIQINAPPTATFISPTRSTGEDYANTENQNPWNMSETTDIANLDTAKYADIWRQFSNPNMADGVFQADANPPLTEIGNTESDVQIHMNIPVNRPIDTSKYRYLSYRMRVDATDYPSIADKVRDGWVTRPVFWNSDVLTDAGSSKAHVTYEGWHIYSIDLWDESIIEAGKPWRSFNNISHLRIDPLETSISTRFYYDWVKLHAENLTTNGFYNVSFQIWDVDNTNMTASLYYDTDNSGFNGVKIADLGTKHRGTYSYNWNTSGLTANAKYYLYLVLNDGLNKEKFYTSVPVVIKDIPAPLPGSASSPNYDYDGDGKSDPAIYRPLEANYYASRSTLGLGVINYGGTNFSPVHGDFDGDGRSDYAMVAVLNGYINWYIIQSYDGALYHALWGLNGDKLAVADYDGDGKDEIAVYRDGAWFILYSTGLSEARYWGLAGDVPAPADYDGDGTADVAIYRPSDGMWWGLYSGYPESETDNYYFGAQWGISGDTPIPADYDADGKAELMVFRSSDGGWYQREIESAEYETAQWGLPGDTPIVADFNGDKEMDLSVVRPAQYFWFANYKNSGSMAVQFGLPGLDSLPQ